MSYNEAILMERFQEWVTAELTKRYSVSPVLIPEFDDGFRRPDLVHVRVKHMPDHLPVDVVAEHVGYSRYANLLSLMKLRAWIKIETLLQRTTSSKYAVMGRLRELRDAGFIHMDGNHAVSLACQLPEIEINAYEGKLTNWKKALIQALTYSCYSDSVRIVMPINGARNAQKREEHFKANGYGLIAADEDWNFTTLYRGRTKRPGNRSYRVFAAGKVLRRLVDDGLTRSLAA